MTDELPIVTMRTMDQLTKLLEEQRMPVIKGNIEGLYGRMPGDLQKLVRKIADAPNYDYAAMELLDAFQIEWRE